MDYNKIFISSRQNEEPEIESFIKNKMKELEKMIPGFAKDKIVQIVLTFYERGIRDGLEYRTSKIKQQIIEKSCCYIRANMAILDVNNKDCMPEWLEKYKKEMEE